MKGNTIRTAAAEVLGTFILVLTITSAAVAATLAKPLAGAPYDSLAVPVADGLALAVLVASLGHITGAHLNPVVTLGLAINRHFAWAHTPAYVIAQFTGRSAPQRSPGPCTETRPEPRRAWGRPTPPPVSARPEYLPPKRSSPSS
jgi:glycerol uptake facilitator-like aquaporin